MAFVLSLLVGRLIQLQGLDASAYAAAAAANREMVVTLPATRGTITDAHGVPLATTVAAVDVTADQTLISEANRTSPAQVAAQLSPLLGIDVATLTQRLTGDKRFVYVARNVDPITWRKITQLDPRPVGIFSQDVGERTYPADTVAANVVGFLGADGKPLGGVELALDDVLKGTDGSERYQRSRDGHQIPGAPSIDKPAVPGSDVRLTLDRDIQWYAQQAITAAVKQYKAEGGDVVVMDPHTGDVLALATAPTFDPNNPGKTPADDRGDRPLQEAYEPGSTGKVITASALIESGAVTPTTHLVVPNRLERGGTRFKDWQEHGTLDLTYAGTLARSSNIGTIEAAEKLGFDKVYPYFAKFGLGQKTGVGLPENPGSVLPPSQWSATTGDTMMFGQGYSVNALQMASVFATVANDGVRMPPRIVDSVTDPSGRTTSPASAKPVRVVSAKTAKTVREMLETVTGPDGTAGVAVVPGYRTAGKTGTANRYDPSCGCYRGFTYSFIGMAPADKPGLVVAVTLQDPKGGDGGGPTCGPVFRDVMSFALQSRRIPPTGTVPSRIPVYLSDKR
ncbi:MAG: peptidoglycan D,D-transpeptidase FtsI family protein [Motilibacteraceae bacterium]